MWEEQYDEIYDEGARYADAARYEFDDLGDALEASLERYVGTQRVTSRNERDAFERGFRSGWEHGA